MTNSTSSSTAILPTDFSKSTADVLRDRWTPGKMRHVIHALKGQPVAIVTDTMTGSTLMGVRLTGLTETASSGHCVVIEGDGPGWPRPVAYRLANCGVIIPLAEDVGQKGSKWTALDTYRNEQSAAIQRAKRENPECDYGKWSAEPGRSKVTWRYEPLCGPEGTNEAFSPFDRETRKMTRGHSLPPFKYGSYAVKDLVEELNYKGEPYQLAA